ncbi:hypothetical protein [Soonwooa sp.]|uniref:hypothetical protein n=1 Tax=Soonwooa sp. TaxID=1938592 RepID=UPI0026093C78|nr:hypothetical protein [Soonwooa sp.]
MYDLITKITSEPTPLPLLIFLVGFSLGIALFHYIFLSALFNMNAKIARLFFILDPVVLIVTWLIWPHYTIVSLLLLFLSLILFAIIGMILSLFRKDEDTDDYVSNRNFNKKYNQKAEKTSAKQIFFVILFFASGALLFHFWGASGIVLLFVGALAIGFAAPTNNKRFLKAQANLPTSKVRSVAMGLAELQGKCQTLTTAKSPIMAKDCIGFRYTIEDEDTDKDGHTTYTTKLDKTVCEDFMLMDDTGSILVKGANISFVWLEQDTQYYDNSQRFTQYLLKANQEVLLVGNVSLENNKPVVAYDSYNKTFGLSDVNQLELYNNSVPLLKQAKAYATIFAILSAIILITPMYFKGNKLIIEKPNFNFFNFKKDKEPKTITDFSEEDNAEQPSATE